MNTKISKEFNFEESDISSISSSDILEDTEFRISSSSSDGPLYELSEIMAHLPIKRGLSKHYHGKSRSFTSLTNVKSIEDLPKKTIPFYGRTMVKPCKSYGRRFDGHHHNYTVFSPKATISKKGSSRVSCMSSSLAR